MLYDDSVRSMEQKRNTATGHAPRSTAILDGLSATPIQRAADMGADATHPSDNSHINTSRQRNVDYCSDNDSAGSVTTMTHSTDSMDKNGNSRPANSEGSSDIGDSDSGDYYLSEDRDTNHSRYHQHQSAESYEQAQLLLVSLLENFCALYDRNPDKNRRLFMAVCKQLLAVGVLTSEDLFRRSEKLRGTYKKAFRDLVLSAIESIEEKSGRNLLTSGREDDGDGDDSAMSDGDISISDSLTSTSGLFELEPVKSRLETDYKDLQIIGKGGFAVVFRGEHRIDHCKYAFKRIQFKSRTSEDYQKIIREIKSLANLDHPNIVRYHGAWIEEKTSSPIFSDVIVAQGRNMDLGTNAAIDDVDEGISTLSIASAHDSTALLKKGIAIPLANPVDRFIVEPLGYYMVIQMELCQFTLADWLEQRNYLISRGVPWHPDAAAGRQSSKLRMRRPMIPPDSIATMVEPGRWAINPAENRRIFKAIVKALQHIHSKGIIHRDLKPGNILFQSDDGVFIPKIGDFGLASDMSVSAEDMSPSNQSTGTVVSQGSDSSVSRSTRTTGLGTCTYAAPEQIRDCEYDEKVDIYSLGIILFELFYPFSTGMERINILEDLKVKKSIPPHFMKVWPKESAFIWSCISEHAQSRPSAKQILESEILDHDLEDSLELLQQENRALRSLLQQERHQMKSLLQKLCDCLEDPSSLECSFEEVKGRLAELDTLPVGKSLF